MKKPSLYDLALALIKEKPLTRGQIFTLLDGNYTLTAISGVLRQMVISDAVHVGGWQKPPPGVRGCPSGIFFIGPGKPAARIKARPRKARYVRPPQAYRRPTAPATPWERTIEELVAYKS